MRPSKGVEPVASGPASSAPAQAPALSLPVESHRSASKAFALFAFFVGNEPAPDTNRLTPVHMMGAYAVQLARYTSEPFVPITIRHIADPGSVAGHEYVAEVRSRMTGAEILANAHDAMAEGDRVVPENEGHRATFSWLDDPKVMDDPAALQAIVGEGDADLHLLATEGPDGLRAVFAWREGEFSSQTVQGFAHHLATVAHALAREPGKTIRELPLLSAQEARWLDEVARGPVTVMPAPLAHLAFEARAVAQPDAPAIRYHDGTLTYHELNARANRLAHLLLQAGVRSGDPVAVALEPGFEIIETLLAILKAGAVYVPVDPGYPPARIAAVLEESNAAVLVSRSGLIERLGLTADRVIDLDTEPQAGLPASNPGLELAHTAPASVYFTSGTTGRPKGVVASRANLAAYVESARARYEVAPGDIIPVIARFSFSISMFELMMPLASGATVLMLDRQQVLDVATMSEVLTQVTFFHCGPSLLRKILHHVDVTGVPPEAFAGVRHASSGGDMVPADVLNRLHATFPNAEVFVIYGCSEVSCMGCTHFYPRGAPVERVFVGAPFENMVARVLDAEGRPLPVGIRGEIHFAGAGITLGYLGRPELTSERFVMIDGERYYRTGDVGRLHRNGAIEILGRNDFQVKLRGMRVELAEVEHHLVRAPGVREAVAAVRADADGEQTLVAWLVLEPSPVDERSRLADVRRHMASSLPDYMVPSSYVPIGAMPLNHNSKLDRRALLDLVATRRSGVRVPGTAMEASMAELWRDLLGVAEVGLDDNFFELGGDSIRALEFIGRMAAVHGVIVDGMDVLRETLEVLARVHDGTKPSGGPIVLRALPDYSLQTFYFGRNQDLYGALHGPGAAGSGRAVLVVAPAAQERVRSHFVLRRLSRELAGQGVPSLCFDLYGTGDSLGRHVDATCSRWQSDIAEALEALRLRTGAREVVAVGVRLGATLLDRTLREEQGRADRVVYWDPVTDGDAYVAGLRAMHRRYVRGMHYVRLGRPPRTGPGTEELLGAAWSREALEEVRTFRLDTLARPGRVVLTTASAWPDAVRIAADCRWDDASVLDDILPDNGLVRGMTREILG